MSGFVWNWNIECNFEKGGVNTLCQKGGMLKFNSFGFRNQCVVENISGCERRGDYVVRVRTGQEVMRGNSLCIRC